ncbi:MauE/DoxX family redox-associated membrane protein [Arcticibacterium luteifluviistationis]|uniref:DoxX family protein n=1 Tax=Arcticibacterium luteifluviistationis TaxID=1784714 RepID=A0A2Z4G8N3_9BACT|nr:MauE/DoxX family redox-associated membrane protein [Arcticibacterium luteifluviistationis]AWV97420.1 DoxX family protein [Arcticibacterium luteifluviistationis]
MILPDLNNKTLAIHLLRISFGINYLFHGVVRIPNLDKFVTGMQNTFQDTLLPDFLVTPLAYAIPFAEIIIGLLLLLNKFTRETLIATFILMNLLVIGSSFAQKWDLVGLQSTYIGFLFLLLYFMNDNQNLIKRNKTS